MPITITDNKKLVLGIRMPADMHADIKEIATYHKTNLTKVVLAMLAEQIKIEKETIKKTA